MDAPKPTAKPPANKPTVPMPMPQRQLVRTAIFGIVDKIADLKSAISSDKRINASLQTYIATELDKLTTNAAEIHLHDIERPDGGFDLHIGVNPLNLGVGDKSVFVRGS